MSEQVTERPHGNAGRALTAEHRAKIAMGRLGAVVSAESRANMSAAQKGRKLAPELVSALAAINTIRLTDAQRALVDECHAAGMGQEAAAKAVGISRRTLVRCLRAEGRSTTARPDAAKPSADTYAAREAIIREHWPTGMSKADLLVLVNAVPGPKIKPAGLGQMLHRLHVRRLPGFSSARRVMGPWTPERTAMLRDLREGAGWDFEAITARLNTLPGPPTTPSAVAVRAKLLHLRLPPKVSAPKPEQVAVTPLPPRRFTYTAPTRDAPVRIAVPDEPVVLPAPNAEGVVEARLGDLMVWCVQNKIEGFDGRQVEALCKIRARMGLPRVVVSWV